MGDLIPFWRTGKKEIDDAILEFLMHQRKMGEAKSRAEVNYHYNSAMDIMKELRAKQKNENDK